MLLIKLKGCITFFVAVFLAAVILAAAAGVLAMIGLRLICWLNARD